MYISHMYAPPTHTPLTHLTHPTHTHTYIHTHTKKIYIHTYNVLFSAISTLKGDQSTLLKILNYNFV